MNQRDKNILDLLEGILILLAQERGEKIANKVKPILLSNLDRGRIQTFTEGKSERLKEYIWRVTNYYERLYPYIHKLQIEKSEDEWEKLMKKLRIWAYSYFLGVNFVPGEGTMEIAKSRATEAAMTLMNAHFPYDVEFDSWARILLIYSCRGYIKKATRKSQIPPEKTLSLDQLANIAGKSMKNPTSLSELRIDLLDAITELSAARQNVLIMLYFDGLSPIQVAEQLGKSVGAIYSLHFNALDDLRKILGEIGNKYE